MRELHVVAVSEDGRHVLLAGKRGATKGGFRVALDGRLGAAVRGDLPRPGEAEPHGSELTPKEIQARLRTGESAESIALAAGVPVARVERFSGPVQGEMALVIDATRSAYLVRGRLGRSAIPLGAAVDSAITQAPSLLEDSTDWSTHREGDGSWLVTVTWFARKRSRQASWRYDPASKSVTAADSVSAALAHVDPEAAAGRPRRRAAPAAAPAKRATAKRPTAKKATAKKAPARKPAAKKAPTRTALQKAPVKRAPAKVVPTRAAVKKVAPKTVAPKRAAVKKVAPTKVAAKRTPKKVAPTKVAAKRTPKKVAPTKVAARVAKAPARKAPIRKAPARKAPIRKAPAPKAATAGVFVVPAAAARAVPAAKKAAPARRAAPVPARALRVVPDPAPSKGKTAAQRDGVKARATVPGWADVLLGTSPGGDR